MKKPLITTLVCLVSCIPFLPAQSLFHDAQTLAEILRQDDASNRDAIFDSGAPRITITEVKEGLTYFFSESGRAISHSTIENMDGSYLITGLQDTDLLSVHRELNGKDTILWEGYASFLPLQEQKIVAKMEYTGYHPGEGDMFAFQDEKGNHLLIPPIFYGMRAYDSNWKLEIKTRDINRVRYYPFIPHRPLYSFWHNEEKSPFEPLIDNQSYLNQEGTYHFYGLAARDTIQLHFPASPLVRLYLTGTDQLTIEKENEQQTLSYRNGFVVQNLLEEVRIRTEIDPKGLTLKMANAKSFMGRKLTLLPDNWNSPSVEIFREDPGNQETQNRILFNDNVRILDTFTYTLKSPDLNRYIIHLLQGADTLATIQSLDSLKVRYKPSENRIWTERIVSNQDRSRQTIARDYVSYLQLSSVEALNESGSPSAPAFDVKSMIESGWLSIYRWEEGRYVTHELEKGNTKPYFRGIAGEEGNIYRLEFDVSSLESESISFLRPDFFHHDFFAPREALLIPVDSEEPYTIYLYFYVQDDIKARIEIDYSPLSIALQDSVPARNIQEVSTILGTHARFREGALTSSNLWGDISYEVRQNPYLGESLSPYLAENRFAQVDSRWDQELRLQVQKNQRQNYPWQDFLYGDRKLDLEKKVSYEELVETYRKPIPSASDNLQLASQRLDSESRRRQGGLNATNIAAGLSDFIVERAQEELNMNFLDRLRSGILSDSSEFKILFPNTRDMLLDFQIVHYRTLLDFAKTSFVTDLQNLGLNFPRLFDLPQYSRLKNDPTVYNIFLIYDLANKVYEGTPMDTVLLHLHHRLLERQVSLDKEINKALGVKLLVDSLSRDSLKSLIISFTEKIDTFDREVAKTATAVKVLVDMVQQKANMVKDERINDRIGNLIVQQENIIDTRFNSLFQMNQEKLEDYQELLKELSDESDDKNSESELIAGAKYQLIKEQFLRGEGAIIANKTGTEQEKSLSQLLIHGDEQDKKVEFQKFRTLIPIHLDGRPHYEYALAKLPPADYESFFDTLNPSNFMAAGLDLTRQMLASNQESNRIDWLKWLEYGEREYNLLVEEINALTAEEENDLLSYLEPFNESLLILLQKDLIEAEMTNIIEGIDSLKQIANSPFDRSELEFNRQSILYLKKLLQEPHLYGIFDWNRMDSWQKAFTAQLGLPSDIKSEDLFFKFIDGSLLNKIASSPAASRKLIRMFQDILPDASQEFEQAVAFMEEVEQRLDQRLRVIMTKSYGIPILLAALNNAPGMNHQALTPADKKRLSRIGPYQFLEEKSSGMKNFEIIEMGKGLFELQFYGLASKGFLKPVDLGKRLDSIAIRLTEIEQEGEKISHYLDKLEQGLDVKGQSKFYKTRQHARDFASLTEMTIHWLDAFRDGSMALDSIIQLDTLVQTVKRTSLRAGVANPLEITYDSVMVRPRSIAAGYGIRKWITKPQFEQLMGDSLTRNVFLGLVYQRLAALDDSPSFSAAGLALTSTKLINAIYEIDEHREQLRYKKRMGENVGFQDYYPFIRTTVDLINILLTTPIGEQALTSRYPSLKNVPKISDESLSLFENVFAQNYAEAIRNVVNLLSVIWQVDQEEAFQEFQAAQASPLTGTGPRTGKPTKAERLERKRNKRAKSNLLVYGSFMANVVGAQTPDQVKGAIKAVAVPPGSSSVKRKSKYNVSLNSYFGAGFFRETLTAPEFADKPVGTSIGLSVPVGVTASVGGLGKNENWSYSLFVPILDIGAVTAFRIDQNNSGSGGSLPELTFGNLIAPGGYFMVNLPKSPFSIGLGAQYGPQTRKITLNGTEMTSSAWRWGLTATIDVPIFNFYNR